MMGSVYLYAWTDQRMGTNRDISPVQESAIGIDKDMLTQPDTIPMVAMERRTDDGRGGNARYPLLQQAPVILIVSTQRVLDASNEKEIYDLFVGAV